MSQSKIVFLVLQEEQRDSDFLFDAGLSRQVRLHSSHRPKARLGSCAGGPRRRQRQGTGAEVQQNSCSGIFFL